MDAANKLQRLARDLKEAGVSEKLLLPVRLPGSLRSFFAGQLTVDDARTAIRSALEAREERFFRICEFDVFGRPRSPYARLFRAAGCEPADLRASLDREGLEETLVRLAREGVYLTSGEFRGKRTVERGSLEFEVDQRDLAPRAASVGLPTESSGSTGRPVGSLASIEWLAAESHSTHLFMAAHGLESSAHAAVDVMLPGAAGMLFLLMLARAGVRPERWFCRRPHHTWLERVYQSLLATEIRLAAERWGVGFPEPEFLDFPDVRPVVEWALELSRQSRECSIRCVGSQAVRIAAAAEQMGVRLDNVIFLVSGEPFTEAKRRTVVASGAKFTVLYGYIQGGAFHVGRGCSERRHIDEMHVDLSTLAVIDNERPSGFGANGHRPLLFTTLLPSASTIHINVENGDHGVLERRSCGCPLGDVGLDLLVHRVRSFEKFTCQGMNYEFSDLYDLMEERLPRQLGGRPGDYQLVEESDGEGRVFLTLRIDPDIAGIDEERALAALRDGLAAGSRGQRLMVRVWSETGALRVRRERPAASLRGKVAPLRSQAEAI